MGGQQSKLSVFKHSRPEGRIKNGAFVVMAANNPMPDQTFDGVAVLLATDDKQCAVIDSTCTEPVIVHAKAIVEAEADDSLENARAACTTNADKLFATAVKKRIRGKTSSVSSPDFPTGAVARAADNKIVVILYKKPVGDKLVVADPVNFFIYSAPEQEFSLERGAVPDVYTKFGATIVDIIQKDCEETLPKITIVFTQYAKLLRETTLTMERLAARKNTTSSCEPVADAK